VSPDYHNWNGLNGLEGGDRNAKEATYSNVFVFLTCMCVVKWEQSDAINKFLLLVMTTLRGDHTCQKSSNYKQAITFTIAHIHNLFQNALETNKMAAIPTNI